MQKYKFSHKGQDEDMWKLHHQALFPVVYKKTAYFATCYIMLITAFQASFLL